MRSRNHNCDNLIGLAVIISYLAACSAVSADPNDVLAKQLTEIRAANRSAVIEPNILEGRCLQLIKDYNSPSEKGTIYATAAFVYCERGFGQPDERQVRLSKTIEYATKTLEYPVDVVTGCRLYGYLSDALITRTTYEPKEAWVGLRQEAAISCLKGLKLALDNKAPKEQPSPPLVVVHNVFSGSGRPPESARRQHARQMAARKEYDRMHELYFQRKALTSRCAMLYSQEPYDSAQLRTHAQKLLLGYSDVVNELLQLVETRIAAKKQPSRPSAPTP